MASVKSERNLKENMQQISLTVKSLETNLKELDRNDNKIVNSLHHEKIKCQGLSNHLEEALKENKQLLNILQQKCSEQNLSRSNSHVDLSSSCSTMSIVHLQYKYEELLVNHHGLLKLLEIKNDEMKKMHDQNSCLKVELETLKLSASTNSEKLTKLHDKIIKLRHKKNRKINKLKTYQETLQLAHNQLVNLLHTQCMEKEVLLSSEIKKCSGSGKALLLQEIRKNNLLAYENFMLHQKLDQLKSMVSTQDKVNSITA